MASTLTSLAQASDSVAIDHFELKIRPLLVQECGDCHGTDEPESGLTLTTVDGLLKGGESGPAIEPGNPTASRLVQALRYTGRIKMPPDGKLADRAIVELVQWIKTGAAMPQPRKQPSPRKPKSRGPLFTDEEKSFWAFRPIGDPAPPQVRRVDWPSTDLDRFVLARLEASGLTPNPRASRRTLIRRATFDLVGLPPTPDEVDAFVNDVSPNAFDKVVDRLLASPHYGERWGRHWLDVARYADSNGGGFDYVYPTAYQYRDYVVAAMNRDLPYDQFLTEQLAGDLLPAGRDAAAYFERLKATGFLTLAPKGLGMQDKFQMELDVVDDQLDVLGRTVMGLTLACARCHDHKFDPIPTQDYYSLAGIFKSTVTLTDTDKNPSYWPESPLELPDVTRARLQYEERWAANQKAVALQRKKAAAEPSSEDAKKQLDKLEAEAEAIAKTIVPKPEFAMVARDASKPNDLTVFLAGNYKNPGPPAPRRFPRILAGEEQAPLNKDTSGRLELARWLTSPTHPLTARVLVNRLWQWHFGEGLVRTPDNFGQLGQRPTHPQLLDRLAMQLIEDGWSLKAVHRRMMLSTVYQQSSVLQEQAFAVDADNRFWWRMNRRRLEAEPLRDAMLATCGQLDRALYGSLQKWKSKDFSVNDSNAETGNYDTSRRTIYLPVVRSSIHEMLQLFDFGDPNSLTARRTNTTVAPQALFMLNSEFVLRQARHLAQRLEEDCSEDSDRIRRAYELCLGRPASEEELQRAQTLLQVVQQENPGPEQEMVAWTMFCQAMFSLNEFMYVE